MKPHDAHKRFRRPPPTGQDAERRAHDERRRGERYKDAQYRNEQQRSEQHKSEQHNGEQHRSERQSVTRAAREDDHTSGARLYGVAPVLEALRAGARSIEQITVAEGAHTARLRELLELARRAGIPVRRAARAEFTRTLGEGINHQGVIAAVAAARYAETSELLDALAARVGTTEQPLAVVLDGVEDPRNLGAILRSVECAGAHAVFIPERRAVGLTETVAKAAAGALEHVAVARAANLVRLIAELKERSIWTIGTSAEAEMEYTAWDYTQPCALFFGGEGTGLHRLVRERCDVRVRIPVHGRIESLNVSVAAGIVLYEALRQRAVAAKKSGEQASPDA
jgi:23S rRNA (guanosine2251-2'-O)-methyltransferase